MMVKHFGDSFSNSLEVCSVAEKDDDMVNAAGMAQQLDLLAWFSYDDGCAWEIGGSCGGGTVMVVAVVVAALKKFVIAGVVAVEGGVVGGGV